MRIYRTAVSVFGPETNFQSTLDAMDRGDSQSKVLLCHSNKKDTYGLKRTKEHGIGCLVSRDDDEILQVSESRGIDLVTLAGYSRILSDYFLENFKGLTLNIRPSLSSKYGGMGMYGIHVHKAVYTHGERESGAAIHLVTGVVDGGQVILQEFTGIEDYHSPEEIQAKVSKIEHGLLPKAIVHSEEA